MSDEYRMEVTGDPDRDCRELGIGLTVLLAVYQERNGASVHEYMVTQLIAVLMANYVAAYGAERAATIAATLARNVAELVRQEGGSTPAGETLQ